MKIILSQIILLALICLTEGWSPVMIDKHLKFRHRFDKLLENDLDDHWYNQTLDHFNVADKRTWKQRYFVNEKFISKERNVAFLNINGEYALTSDSGLFLTLAKQYKACVFELEHRFYGTSQPTKDKSLDNLKYLSTEQALADIAAFIKAMNKEYKLSPDVKWIVSGGSYAGALAAWARLKLPDLIHGAVSISGPILAKLNFNEYYGRIYEDLHATYGTKCTNQIEKAFKQLDEMLQNPAKHNEINKIFNLCYPIQDSLKNNQSVDITNFYDTLIHGFAAAAQFGYKNDGSNPMGVKICQRISDTQLGDEIHRLGVLTHELTTGPACFDHRYARQIEKLQDVTIDRYELVGMRQFTYQMCSELGYFETTDHKPQIFGNRVTLEDRLRTCSDLFGFDEKFMSTAIDRTNSLYGGLDLNATNVVTIHGSKDPWSELGLRRTLNPASPVIVIEGVAHCATEAEPKETDVPQLKAARVQVSNIVGAWLK